ncbi:hypothetical protein D3C73_1544760 [compost metagenome]
MMRHKFIHAPFHFKDFTGMNFNIRCLALVTAQRLVDHDARVRQAEAFIFCPCSQQERAH